MTINFDMVTLVAQIRDMCADDDEQTLLDTLEAATDFNEVADMLIASEMDSSAMAAAVKAQEDALKMRRERIEWRAKQKREALLKLLSASGLKKLERPLATISRVSGRISVDITDEADIPSQLRKVVSSPDKAAIKKQIEAGEVVPGAVLTRGADTLSVRIK